MARKATQAAAIEVVDELPKRQYNGEYIWVERLKPLTTQKRLFNRWCLIHTYDDPVGAESAQKNLTQRRVKFPLPNHDWTFAARGPELYAIFRGPHRAARSRTKNSPPATRRK